MNSITLSILMFVLDTSLVTGLGDENFTVREACARVLTGRGWQAHVSLESGMTNRDVEISHTSQLIWTQALDAEINLLRSPDGTLPEIDAAWYDVENTCYRPSEFLSRYDHMVPYLDSVGRDGYPWENYRAATYLWIVAEIKSGESVSSLGPIIAEMRYRDEKFLEQHRNRTMWRGQE